LSNKKLGEVLKKVGKQASKVKFKRLYFDIETSPNQVFSWNIGYNLTLTHDNIIKERAIICICYKWEHEDKVHYLKWDKGDDKKLVQDFADIINSCDEAIGHNSDRYDTKWVRTRALFHRIPMQPKIQSIDTLKLSKSGFRFNSNRLDYISQFLGFGKKMDTGGFGLWKEIVLNNNTKAMSTMIEYCKKDVILLEKVHKALDNYTPHKIHKGVFEGKHKCSCPGCGSSNVVSNGNRITAAGTKFKKMQCLNCGKYYSVSEKVYEEFVGK
jgi:RNase H-like protein